MVWPGFIYRLTVLNLWVTATGERDLLGASATPSGFCTGSFINLLPVSGAHVVPQGKDLGSQHLQQACTALGGSPRLPGVEISGSSRFFLSLWLFI